MISLGSFRRSLAALIKDRLPKRCCIPLKEALKIFFALGK
ncbi:hypothetical protein DB42_CV00030 [Neochlamydia sp. EPS4]|nr:hypothetical protein DB42_CV00030 [Neochlamydia sp. EPS4]